MDQLSDDELMQMIEQATDAIPELMCRPIFQSPVVARLLTERLFVNLWYALEAHPCARIETDEGTFVPRPPKKTRSA
jgi:hypothetical protein